MFDPALLSLSFSPSRSLCLSGERPFKCSHCGKAFNQKVVLQTHMARHTGEKPHLCMFCPASFSQRGNLHSHVQRVHSEVRATNCCVARCLPQTLTATSAKHTAGNVSASSNCDGQRFVTCPLWNLSLLRELCFYMWSLHDDKRDL